MRTTWRRTCASTLTFSEIAFNFRVTFDLMVFALALPLRAHDPGDIAELVKRADATIDRYDQALLAKARATIPKAYAEALPAEAADPTRLHELHGVEPPEEVIERNTAIYRERLPNAQVSIIARVGFDVAASCGMFFGPGGPVANAIPLRRT